MRKLVVFMWLAIVLVVGLTTWLLLRTKLSPPPLVFVSRAELERVREEAHRELQGEEKIVREFAKAANRATEQRRQVEVEFQQFRRRDDRAILRAIAQFQDGLKHEDTAVRQWAAESLGKLGALAKDAVPALAESLLNDASDSVRQASGEALKNIEAEAAAEASFRP